MYGPYGSKLLFTILLHRHSPSAFDQLWERRYQKECPPNLTDEEKERRLIRHQTADPRIHKYNDIAGFAEVYWDSGSRMLIDYYFIGDRRTRYGRTVWASQAGFTSAHKFYLHSASVNSGSFFLGEDDVEKKRNAVFEALDALERKAKQLNCYVDTTAEREITRCLDVSKFFMRNFD